MNGCISWIKIIYYKIFRKKEQTVALDLYSFPCDEPPSIYSKKCTEDIIIENDKLIGEIKVYDCNSIRVINCPKITKIPDMYYFNNLEILRIQHCTIKQCYTYFPNSLRTLELSYCCMSDFSPSNFPNKLTELDLSFNNLKSIPSIIEKILDKNIIINLRNNDFWYTMYSDLSPLLICSETVKELVLANKLNLVSTIKLKNAVNILNLKKCSKEANWLSEQIQISLDKKKQLDQTVYTNPENIHLKSVQDNVEKSINYIMSYQIVKLYNISQAINELKLLNLPPDAITFLYFCIENHVYHSGYKITYVEIFEKIYSIIKESLYKECLMAILKSEIVDGMNTCLTGQITRLLNVLSGFLPGVVITINRKEETSNSIIALRKKFAMMYGENTDIYIQEAVPAVWQLLEDMCIPECEHEIWLEYV